MQVHLLQTLQRIVNIIVRTVLSAVSICFSHNDATFFRIICPNQGGTLHYVVPSKSLLCKPANKSCHYCCCELLHEINYVLQGGATENNCYVLLLIVLSEESCRSETECKTGLFIKNDL